MKIDKKLLKIKSRRAAILPLLFLLTACAAPVIVKTVEPGNVADINFLCRSQKGEVMAATQKALEKQSTLPKSRIFLSENIKGPIPVTVGSLMPQPPKGEEIPFEEQIINRLAGVVVGMKEGEERKVELTASELPERKSVNYVISLARVRIREKEIHMPIATYKVRAGKAPEVGDIIIDDPAIPGRVETVTPEEALIRFSAKPGDIVETPFGPGHIRELETTYEIVLDVRKGDLVRSGNILGRISGVNENFIFIDYRHPFGGETLTCDVAVEKVTDEKPAKNKTGE